MPYYEYEYIVKNLIDLLKEKQEAEEKQHEEAEGKQSMGGAMKEAGKYMPAGLSNMASKASSGNFNTGGFNMPSMPNFPGIPSSMKI